MEQMNLAAQSVTESSQTDLVDLNVSIQHLRDVDLCLVGGGMGDVLQ